MRYTINIIFSLLLIISSLVAETDKIITEQEIEDLRSDIYKARPGKINSSVGFDFSTGGSGNATYFNHKPSTNARFYPNINSGSKIGIKANPGTGLEFKVELSLDTYDDPSMTSFGPISGHHLFGYSFGNIEVDMNITTSDYAVKFRAGGPFYSGMEGSGSPLVNGKINGEGGKFLFERRDWYTVEMPEKYYADNYKAAGAYEEGDRSSSGADGKGFFGQFTYYPFSSKILLLINKKGFQNASVQYYSKIDKENVLIPGNTVGLAYSYDVVNPNNTFIKDEVHNTTGLEITGSHFLKYQLTGAYSVSDFPKDTDEDSNSATGNAAIAILSRQMPGFLFVNYWVPQTRFFYASPDFAGSTVRRTHLIADKYGKQRTVMPMDDMIHCNSGSYTYFISSQFQFLTKTGKLKLVYGESRNTTETWNRIKLPHRMNHRIWFDHAGAFQADAGYPGLYTDGQDWDDTVDSDGMSSEVFDWFIAEDDTETEVVVTTTNKITVTNAIVHKWDHSRKKHTLYRIEFYYNLNEIIPMKYPLYYISRNVFSDIKFLNFYNPELDTYKESKDNEKVRYSWVDHFFAFGLKPDFYIIAFYSIERHHFNYPELYKEKRVWNMSADGTTGGAPGYGPARYELKDIGYGLGYDWFFKGNMQMFFKVRWFNHYDKYRPQFDFDGYKIIVEFRTYFTYG